MPELVELATVVTPAPALVPITLQADAQTKLSAKVWMPASPEQAGVGVIINAGAGIRSSFYERYAIFLARAGLIVLTYDYRGIGDSRPSTLRGYPASVEDWGSKDCASALDWIHRQFPTVRLALLGHSVGAFLTGFASNAALIERFITIGGHTAYWRDYAPKSRMPMYLMWHLLMPALTSAVGYFPGKTLRLLEDLPAGVAREWAQRVRPEFYWNVRNARGEPDKLRIAELLGRFADVRANLLAYSFTDDPFATKVATDRLIATFPGCTPLHVRISPSERGVRSIGHFGFFRERFRETLWRESAEWLLSGSLSCPSERHHAGEKANPPVA